jgi:transcriptional regulator with XRE-family HTH domain
VSQNAKDPEVRHPACVIVGRNVRRMRDIRGWSQEFLGKKVGQRQGTISAIERGERCPSLQGLFRLAEAFGVDPEGLVGCRTARKVGAVEKPV